MGILLPTVMVSTLVYAQQPPGVTPAPGTFQSSSPQTNPALPPNEHDAAIADKLLLVLTPERPKPNSVAMVEVKTTVFDLNRTTIGWLEDGKLMESGIGKTRHQFVAGKTGSSLILTAVVQTPEGGVVETSITVHPASVDLVWESPSTVPPFYRGKALYVMFGKLSITAIPDVIDQDGIQIPDSNLIYTWYKNTEILAKSSGYGRNVLVFSSPELRLPFTISVDVDLPDKTPVANETITINGSDPTVLMYENSPLYGILFNREVGTRATLTSKEITFEVFPYFFNTTNRNRLTYIWNINYIPASGFNGPFITLRDTGNQAGVSSVSVEVVNGNLFTEDITKAISINFGR